MIATRALSIRSSLKIQGVIFDYQLIAQQVSEPNEAAYSNTAGGDLQQASAAHKQAPTPEQTAVGSVMQMMQLIKQRNSSSLDAEVGSLSALSGANKQEQQQQQQQQHVLQPRSAAATTAAPQAAVDTNDVRIKYLRKLQERTGGRTSAGAASKGDSDLLAAARLRTDIAGNRT
jgi:hypothetical protein